MKLVVDYNEEKNSECYYNNVMSAVEAVKEHFYINKAEFVNFPFSEVTYVLALINESTKTGTVEITKNAIIYVANENNLHFQMPESL